MASLSPVIATSATLESHAAVRKQIVDMFNPKADQSAVAGRSPRKIDSKIAALAAAMAKDSASKAGSQGLGGRSVSTVETTPVSVQPKAAPRQATDSTPLLPKGAEEQAELTCCQKVMKAVCCCFSS